MVVEHGGYSTIRYSTNNFHVDLHIVTMSNNNDHTSEVSIGTFDVNSKISIPSDGAFAEPLSQLTDIPNNETSAFRQTSLDKGDSPNINQSTFDTTTISIKMSNFDGDNPSTHLFMKPARGSLYNWEYESRKYFFIFLLKPFMHQIDLKYRRQSQQITFKKIRDHYKKITGQKIFPPFFQFHEGKGIYIQMTDTEISDYIKNILTNISRVKKTINKFSEDEIKDNNISPQEIIKFMTEDEDDINDEVEDSNTDHLTISPQEIINLTAEVASNVNDSKRKELFDIISSFKKNNCKKKRKR